VQGQSQILVSAVDGDIPTAIGGLLLSRRTSPSPVVRLAQGPMFGMVMQGNKSMRLGNEVQHYGVGRLSARMFDVPVTSRFDAPGGQNRCAKSDAKA
jgi:hypothetical protein